jgi:hypothetical protein
MARRIPINGAKGQRKTGEPLAKPFGFARKLFVIRYYYWCNSFLAGALKRITNNNCSCGNLFGEPDSKNISLPTYSQIAIEPFRWILCVKKGVYEGEKYGEIP